MACDLHGRYNQEVLGLLVIANGISHIGGKSYKTAGLQTHTISIRKTFVHAEPSTRHPSGAACWLWFVCQ